MAPAHLPAVPPSCLTASSGPQSGHVRQDDICRRTWLVPAVRNLPPPTPADGIRAVVALVL